MRDIRDYSLRAHNTFGIEARCRRFVEYDTEEELTDILQQLRAEGEEKLLHIGGGSNLLFTQDYDGVVLHSAIRGVELVAEEPGGDVLVRGGAGEEWDAFVAACCRRGFYGLENLSYIPGEVGASAVQNIGAYGAEVARFIETVEAVELPTGLRRTFSGSECRYGYRDSIFKRELRGRYAVTRVVFRLSRHFAPDLNYAALSRELAARGIDGKQLTPQALRQVVTDVRRSKLPEPSETGSAGSFFVNPVVPAAQFEALRAKYPDMPHYELPDGVKVPAGWLIQQCGWKGRSLGRAGVWPQQALVLVNLGGATGQDIVALSRAVQADVEERFGIRLQPEVNFI